MAATALPQRVAAVRRFNRFYTKQIGLLHEHLLRSPFSLTEARVLYELSHHTTTTATELGKELGLDPGYLSRMLRRFQVRGLLDRKPSQSDGRQSVLSLTPRGLRPAQPGLTPRHRRPVADAAATGAAAPGSGDAHD